ncbi:MAG: DNA polymerase/3'-5' exonuclease PolX [Planctomycetaceae bacterium]|nr:MAG: DNA polymerase/3'-5' exonuclease PolX [Planctomycetaceae bacterium]
MQNVALAAAFEELADLLELQGANPFRVRAYRQAARTLESWPQPIADLLQDPSFKLTELPGIGDDLAQKIKTLVETGELPQLEALRRQYPADVLQMLKIPGLGPKKVATPLRELAIHSLAELKHAAETGRIAQLKGFGAKTEHTILQGLQLLEQAGQRVLLSVAKPWAEAIVHDLRQVPHVQQVEAAGSLRRRRETCGDLDILAVSSQPQVVMDRLAAHPLVAAVLARGDTKQRVRLHGGMELDLRVVPAESYGAALQYFTGSKEHNLALRRRAQERGLKINEYGVFRGDQYLGGRTEEEVYAAVGLPWIPPELRENRGEIELAERHQLPHLIERRDLRGDLHMHTTASDGAASVRDMVLAAKERGHRYIAITDHSPRVSLAHGLDATRLRAHWRQIEKLRREISGIEILCGVECDILEDARMDLPDDVLAEADWVIASLHYGLKQPREQIQRRLQAALQHPYVDVIGHPSGRLIGSRAGADLDYQQLFRMAQDHGKMLEINASPQRLDLDDVHAAAARDHGVLLVISTDAHSVPGLDQLEYGVYVARRAGLTAQDVANTRSWRDFQKLLRRRR